MYCFLPLDFTFVCPTELHAFNDRIEDFRKRDTELVAVSVDSHYSHYAWLSTPKSQGGIQGIEYPVVSDIKKEISKAYDVLFEDQGVAYRGLFLIDDKFIVRHHCKHLPLGRSVNEVLRMIDALSTIPGMGRSALPTGRKEKGRSFRLRRTKGIFHSIIKGIFRCFQLKSRTLFKKKRKYDSKRSVYKCKDGCCSGVALEWNESLSAVEKMKELKVNTTDAAKEKHVPVIERKS